jgi:uncharacterized membrane protein YsdA (DUF1294 family)
VEPFGKSKTQKEDFSFLFVVPKCQNIIVLALIH